MGAVDTNDRPDTHEELSAAFAELRDSAPSVDADRIWGRIRSEIAEPASESEQPADQRVAVVPAEVPAPADSPQVTDEARRGDGGSSRPDRPRWTRPGWNWAAVEVPSLAAAIAIAAMVLVGDAAEPHGEAFVATSEALPVAAAELVADGELTEAEIAALEGRVDQLLEEFEAVDGLSPERRAAALQALIEADEALAAIEGAGESTAQLRRSLAALITELLEPAGEAASAGDGGGRSPASSGGASGDGQGSEQGSASLLNAGGFSEEPTPPAGSADDDDGDALDGDDDASEEGTAPDDDEADEDGDDAGSTPDGDDEDAGAEDDGAADGDGADSDAADSGDVDESDGASPSADGDAETSEAEGADGGEPDGAAESDASEEEADETAEGGDAAEGSEPADGEEDEGGDAEAAEEDEEPAEEYPAPGDGDEGDGDEGDDDD